ncbi:SSI family serine proteinase inhibitor [Salinactinospora qingdaonensis]|uniref:Subtilisin inhibitor domain-containing protein n=1 Tax=Salinactinospora qingdaonensis TaxID=702744 RepID=A0ABP7FB00_9ACTN
MRTAKLFGTLAALVMGAVAVAATPAAAESPFEPLPAPNASYTMVMYEAGITLDDPTAAVPPTAIARATLECYPHGGTHPTPEAACESLWQVGGEFDQLPTDPAAVCPAVVRPVTVEVKGHWFNEPAHFKHTYNNRCLAAVESDNVFRF